jgi:hypothetical protein
MTSKGLVPKKEEEGRKEGRKERRKEGKKEGRKEEQQHEMNQGQTVTYCCFALCRRKACGVS